MEARFTLYMIFLKLLGKSQGIVTLSSQPVTAWEGSTYNLICNTDGGQAWSASWYFNGAVALTVSRSAEGTPDCGSGSRLHLNGILIQLHGTCFSHGRSFSLAILNIPATLNKTLWTCSMDGSARSRSYEVIVRGRPKITMKMTPNNGIINDTVILTEGNEIQVLCSVTLYSKPAAVYDYTINITRSRGTNFIHLPGNTGEARWNVTRDYRYISCSFSEDNQLLSNVTLLMDIQYPPSVVVSTKSGNKLNLGGKVTLLCDVTANPEAREVIWLHYWNSTIIREFNTSVSDYSLTLGNLTYEDDGDYYCNVSNGVGEGYPNNSTHVRISGRPLFFTPADSRVVKREMEEVRLVFRYLDNSMTRIKKWMFNGYLHSLGESMNASVQMTMHNVMVVREGQEATLTFSSVTTDHTGNYSMTVCSTLGCSQSESIELLVLDAGTSGNNSETNTPKGDESNSETNTPKRDERVSLLSFLLPVCVAVGSVIVIGLVIVVVYRKRRHQREGNQSSSYLNSGIKNDAIRQCHADSLVLAENVLYDRTSMDLRQIKENDNTTTSVHDQELARRSVPVMQDNVLYEETDFHDRTSDDKDDMSTLYTNVNHS